MKVVLFARAKDLAGTDSVEVALPSGAPSANFGARSPGNSPPSRHSSNAPPGRRRRIRGG